MAHPYKSYDEHRHGRSVAAKRAKGYDSGGAVKRQSGGSVSKFHKSLGEDYIRTNERINSRRGMQHDAENALDVSDAVPRNRPKAGDSAPAYKSGGRISAMTGGADSGVGRMELSRIQARKRK